MTPKRNHDAWNPGIDRRSFLTLSAQALAASAFLPGVLASGAIKDSNGTTATVTTNAGKVRGRLVDGVLTVRASEHRSQLRNREAALERMAKILADALAPPPPRRRPTKPRRGAIERRLADKKRRSRTKRLRRSDED